MKGLFSALNQQRQAIDNTYQHLANQADSAHVDQMQQVQAAQIEQREQSISRKKRNEVEDLYEENRKLRAQLRETEEERERAENLAKSRFLECSGLINTIQHLQQAWNSPEPAAKPLTMVDIQVILDEKHLEVSKSEEEHQNAREMTERVVRRNKNSTNRSPR